MKTNQDLLLDEAKQQFVNVERHCNICAHCHLRRARYGIIYGPLVETCRHPKLNPNDPDGWPEVNSGLVCKWFKGKVEKS